MADIKITGRRTRTSAAGIAIEREFCVERYKDFPEVIKALQGSVTRPAVGQPWARTPPAKDPYIPACYCHETRTDFWHRDSMCSSDKLDTTGQLTTLEKLETVQESPAEGAAGAKITAIYRPLHSAWPDAKAPNSPFDWIDPAFDVSFQQIPWPEGLHIRVRKAGPINTAGVPKEVAQPIQIPVYDFSIRRVLVGEPPWLQIRSLAGKVNSENFPEQVAGLKENLPLFRPRTLRFEGAKVLNRVDTEGTRIYEIRYNFSWINTYSHTIVTQDGAQVSGAVTWNHVFTKPWWVSGFFGIADPKMGWYTVLRTKRVVGGLLLAIGGIRTSEGLLYDESPDFMKLFLLNP